MSGTYFQDLVAAAELLVGFVIVMLTLAVLWGMTALMGHVVGRLEGRPRRAAVTAPAATPRPVTALPSDGRAAMGADDEELAVIAAAVALVLDVPHRVVHVEPRPSAWGDQGRRDIHGSHRIH